MDRYHRQILLPAIGEAGQRRLCESHVLVVGCGALGTTIAEALARGGVGTIGIVDRDTVELTNLQRQVLFTEQDVRDMLPKATAATDRLARINSDVEVRPYVEDFNYRNARRILDDADVVIDGLDNFETRYLVNDLAVRCGRPYVYGGAVVTSGMTMTVLPHPDHRDPHERPRIEWSPEQSTPCLRCVFPDPPPPGSTPTCDTAGVLGPAVTTIAALQVAETFKLLTGNIDALDRRLRSIDVWTGQFRGLDVRDARRACRCCVEGRFDYLDGSAASSTTTLCGRQAIQITPAGEGVLDLAALAGRLEPHGAFVYTGHLLHGRFDAKRADLTGPIEMTLFPDGRAIIKGTSEPETARSIYARFVGS